MLFRSPSVGVATTGTPKHIASNKTVGKASEGAKEILNNLTNAYISNSFTDSDEFAKLLEQAYCQPKIDLSSYLKIYDEKVICASLINSCI